MDRDALEIIYDGECPFCTRYVALVRLREAVGPVALIDARSDDPRVAAVQAEGYDLNVGMVVRHRGVVHHGPAAVAVLTRLSRGGLLRHLMRPFFANPRLAAPAYRVLAAGRRGALRLLGKPPIPPARTPCSE
ncbi:MAG: thiol-disulfide oxidoreductase DCC family protein [Alphaproteobacteria bacterium]